MSYLKRFKSKASSVFQRAKHFARRTKALSTILSHVMHKHPMLRILHKQAVKHGYGRRHIIHGGRRGRRGGNIESAADMPRFGEMPRRTISPNRMSRAASIYKRAASNIDYARSVVNKMTSPIYKSIAYGIEPAEIPKLSVDLWRKNNPLGLGGNWRE